MTPNRFFRNLIVPSIKEEKEWERKETDGPEYPYDKKYTEEEKSAWLAHINRYIEEIKEREGTMPLIASVEKFEEMPMSEWLKTRVGRIFAHPQEYVAYRHMQLGHARYQITQDFLEIERKNGHGSFFPGPKYRYWENDSINEGESPVDKPVGDVDNNLPEISPQRMVESISAQINHALATADVLKQRNEARAMKIAELANYNETDTRIIEQLEKLANGLEKLIQSAGTP